MRIEVMSQYRALEYIPHDVTAIISITASFDKEPLEFIGVPEDLVLRLKFDDCDPNNILEHNVLFDRDMADKVWDFVESIRDRVGTLVVHCYFGQSRSAGMAAAIGKYILGTDSFVFDGSYVPNMYVYRTMLEAKYGQTYNGVG